MEGLEPVRKRPGMYIGGTGKAGLHHLVWEIVDNAVDEATNGYATQIEVVLAPRRQDGLRVRQRPRHPGRQAPDQEGARPSQVILTTLHAGGKFDGVSYVTSGGLHGVGSSVVNALSSELVAQVKRDGELYEQRYARGVPVTKLKKVRSNVRGTGHDDHVHARRRDLRQARTSTRETIKDNLEVKTYLNGALRIVFKDEATGERDRVPPRGRHRRVPRPPGGGRPRRGASTRTRSSSARRTLEDGLRTELCFVWTEAPRESITSFVNGIPTRDGGTHEQGLKDGVTKAIRNYIETHDLAPEASSTSRPTTSARGWSRSSTCTTSTRSSRGRRRRS